MRSATLVIAASLLCLTARAEPTTQIVATPTWRFVVSNLAVFRYNPVGLEDQLRVGAVRRLFTRRGRLFGDTFAFLGIAPKLNPAYVKLGPSLELQPLSVLNLRLTAEYVDYFSSFGYVQSFQSPLDDYSDTVMNQRKDLGLNYATSGVHVAFEPTIQLKLGPVAIRNRFALEYWRISLHDQDRVWYEVTLDTLVPANGLVMADDLDVLYVSRYRLVAGLRYSMVEPIYSAGDFRPGEPQRTSNGHQRLGPLLMYMFYDHGPSRFNRPSLLLIVNWYVDHRYRTGADVPAALPYVILGFSFQSDLIR